ncbi:MAG TPA: zf-HC2 domain-containing protein [Gemmatimonadales bacterium]|nr:zf-HC2 domain-containing protein [Gemmatimonadales bacterium]
MSHLDEGTLHALLDGELDLHEVKEIQAHIGSCAACGTRLREVKEFHGESDRLVGILELPSTPSRRTAPADPEPAAYADDRGERRRQGRDLPRVSGPLNEPPPLLLPENPGYQRGGLMRRMRWAALILVTVGAGYMAMRRPSNFAFEGELVPVRIGDSTPTAVLSSEEDASGRTPAVPTDTPGVTNEPATPSAAKSAAPAPQRTAQRATPPATQPARAAEAREQAAADDDDGERTGTGAQDRELADAGSESRDIAGGRAADTADERAESAGADDESADDQPAGEAPPTARERDVRAEAAVALAQLDRERQVERADAATAALDSARRREAVTRQASTTQPPAPRTPEQRAQIYLRIGLDEAAKQLGRPVHVIEGMSPLFMGLVLGRNSPGADATRPVVRVVYQDSRGRLIFLDQQRLRPGQSTAQPGADPHWVTGEIALHLSGEVGSDILRNYRARVR